MSLLGRLIERRDISFQTLWGSGGDIADLRGSDAGVSVTQSSALGLTTAYACVSLLADTVSTLPAGTFTRNGTTRIPATRPAWMMQPEADDPNSTWETHLSEVMVSLLLDGNAFVFTGRDDNGDVIEVRAVDPSIVEPKRVAGGIIYEVRRANGGVDRLTANEMRHIWRIRRPGALRGMSPIEAARQSLGKALAAEKFGARFFGSGAHLTGYIKTDAKIDQATADEIKAKWKARHSGVSNAHDVGVLDAGAEWKSLSIPPDQAQFLATLEHADEDCARLFRVPPPLAGITKPGAMAYASVDALLTGFEKFSVRPYVEIIESAYRPLLPPRVFLRLNTNGLLRGDFKSRMEGYAVGINSGMTLRSEARTLEDLPPVTGLDAPLVPLNMANASTADLSQRASALAALVKAGLDPAASAALLGLPPIERTSEPQQETPA